MGNYTKQGTPKAKMVKDLYRNPQYKGGKCSVCRKRMRDYMHAEYPHMCAHCLKTRVARHNAPIMAAESMARQMQTDQRLLAEYLTRKYPSTVEQPKPVQTLNRPTIEDSAARFRAHAAANPITDEQRKRIAESAARFRATVGKK